MDRLIEIEALDRKETNFEEKLTIWKFFFTKYKIIHRSVALNNVR